MTTPLVEVCSPEEAARYIRALENQGPSGFRLTGHVDALCREVSDGSVAWEIHQSNIITNGLRQKHADGMNNVFYVVTSPSSQAANDDRWSLSDDGSADSAQQSAGISGVFDGPTWTKSWTPTPFGTPGANRKIGMIGLSNILYKAVYGLCNLMAYTILSPSKVQTTSQTLEVIYRITLTPLY